MDKATLGRTGLEVSALSLGGLFVARGTDELQKSIDVVRKAYALGINYVDTAPNYGESETVLGRIFKETGAPAILSTKLGGVPGTFEPRNGDMLKASIENSLTLLGVDHFEMVMVHEPDRPRLYDWWTDMLKVEGPVLEVLEDYRRQGVVKNLGLGGTGVVELAHLVKSGKFDVVLTAFNYSILWREAEDTVIKAARENNVGVIAGSPLQQGALAVRYDSVYDEDVYWLHPARRQQLKDLYAFSDEIGMPLPEMAIRFVRSNPDVDTVLMGARTVEEVEQNAAAAERGPLPAEVLARLDELAARIPFRPTGEPAGIGARLARPAAYKGPGGIAY